MVNRESLAGGQLFSAGSCGISGVWSMLNHGSRRESPRASTVFNRFSRGYPRAPTVFRSFSGISAGTPTGTHGISRFAAGIVTISHCISANDPAGISTVFRCIPRSSAISRGNPHKRPQLPWEFPRARAVSSGVPREPPRVPTVPSVSHGIPRIAAASRGNPHGHPQSSVGVRGFPQ